MVHIQPSFRQSALLSKVTLVLLGWASALSAHDMTPAYPELRPSHIAGVVKTKMSLFNARSDVKYYQIEVFDSEWVNVPFSTTYRILKIEHKERKDFDVYLRKIDVGRAVYLCTTSKVKKISGVNTLVSSRICSRLDGGKP